MSNIIIAHYYSVDPNGPEGGIIGLRVVPIPGDILRLKDGRGLRVLRRTFNEIYDGKTDLVDVELGVRYEQPAAE